MRDWSHAFALGHDRAESRRRAVAITLALLVEALIIIALLSFGLSDAPLKTAGSTLTTFNFAPETASSKPKSQPVAKKPVAAVDKLDTTKAPLPAPRDDVIVRMSKADFEASDIAKLPSSGGQGNAGAGQDSVAATGPGEGPGGAPLYKAEWYREPTRAELDGYLPPNRPPGAWAIIACRTIERYQVENCVSLGESPPGSGLARALRQAAWQFRVLPPRVGNKPLIGAWVRIRFDFTKDAPD